MRFRFEPARIRVATFGGHIPKPIVGFNRAIGIENVHENIAAVARADAGQVRTDLSALAVEEMAIRAIRGEYLFAPLGVALFFGQWQKLLHDFLAIGGDAGIHFSQSLRAAGDPSVWILL